jgi:hypothetical protein
MGINSSGKPKAKKSATRQEQRYDLPELNSIEQIKLPDSWLISNVIPLVLDNKYKWTTEDLSKLIKTPNSSPKKNQKRKKKADSATKIKQEEQTEEKNKRQKLLFDISDEAETFLEKVEEMDISSWNPKTMKEMYLKQNKYLHGINDHLNYFRSDTKVFKDEEEEEDDKDK